jgi:hypothetical protein
MDSRAPAPMRCRRYVVSSLQAHEPGRLSLLIRMPRKPAKVVRRPQIDTRRRGASLPTPDGVIDAPLTTSAYALDRGSSGSTVDANHDANAAGAFSVHIESSAVIPGRAEGASCAAQLETVGADHRARTRRCQPHRLQQDIHPRIVIVHRQEP